MFLTATAMTTAGFLQTLMFSRAYLSQKEKQKTKSSICYCSLGDGATEWQHGEAITAGTGAKLQAPEQIQGKVVTYLDLI